MIIISSSNNSDEEAEEDNCKEGKDGLSIIENRNNDGVEELSASSFVSSCSKKTQQQQE